VSEAPPRTAFPAPAASDLCVPASKRIRGLDRPRRLCLELNEVTLVGDPVVLAPRARVLRQRTGCRVAIDDVGLGRSSLEALIVLEPDIIKIDRSYVNGAHRDRAQRRHLERLHHVGRALGAQVIAEGVEFEEDRVVLEELGIEFAQGYLWGRPGPISRLGASFDTGGW
jgi:EAL domain-containing protein (putative c-di-GMP-specific phosphodiesterase class I)